MNTIEATYDEIKEDTWLFTEMGKNSDLQKIVFFPDELIGDKFAHPNSAFAIPKPNHRSLTVKEKFTIQILRDNQ